MLEKTDFDTVDLILKHFDLLDVNNDKVLDKEDIILAKQLARPDDIFQAAKQFKKSKASSASPTRMGSGAPSPTRQKSAGRAAKSSSSSSLTMSTSSGGGTMEI